MVMFQSTQMGAQFSNNPNSTSGSKNISGNPIKLMPEGPRLILCGRGPISAKVTQSIPTHALRKIFALHLVGE